MSDPTPNDAAETEKLGSQQSFRVLMRREAFVGSHIDPIDRQRCLAERIAYLLFPAVNLVEHCGGIGKSGAQIRVVV